MLTERFAPPAPSVPLGLEIIQLQPRFSSTQLGEQGKGHAERLAQSSSKDNSFLIQTLEIANFYIVYLENHVAQAMPLEIHAKERT